jgi:polyisoprenoid-binding protein YceI
MFPSSTGLKNAARGASIASSPVALQITPRFRVKGRLEIKGKTRELSFVVRPIGPDWVCEVKLHQPDFGIKPFSAMLGAMKIKPDVDVRLSVPKSRVG